MIENRAATLAAFIKPFRERTRSAVKANGKTLHVSSGMAEAGYDITLASPVTLYAGYSVLGVTAEHVAMPANMSARVIGKSTWARLGVHLNVTEIDPGFVGHVTLELSYMPRWRGWWAHANRALFWPARLTIPAGTGIGCLQFVYTSEPARYDGKYQNQPAKPVDAK